MIDAMTPEQVLTTPEKQQCWGCNACEKKETTTNGAKAETICIPGNLAMVAMPQIETKNKNKKQQPTSWIAASSREKGKNKTNNEMIT